MSENNLIYTIADINSCDTMQYGAIPGSTHGEPLSIIIEDVEQCKVSHSGMFYWKIINGVRTLMVFEAKIDGIECNDFVKNYMNDPQPSYLWCQKPTFDLTGGIPNLTLDQVIVQFGVKMQSYVGNSGYDVKNLTLFQLAKFFIKKALGKDLSQYIIDEFFEHMIKNNPDEFICDQFVKYIYHYFTGLFPNWKSSSPDETYNDNINFTHWQIIR